MRYYPMPKGPQGRVASPLWSIWLVAAALILSLGLDLFELRRIPNGAVITALGSSLTLIALIWRRHVKGS